MATAALLLLQLLKGCDKIREGDSNLGDHKMCEDRGSGPFFYKLNKIELKIETSLSEI